MLHDASVDVGLNTEDEESSMKLVMYFKKELDHVSMVGVKANRNKGEFQSEMMQKNPEVLKLKDLNKTC